VVCVVAEPTGPLTLSPLPAREGLGEEHEGELVVVDLAVLVDVRQLQRLRHLGFRGCGLERQEVVACVRV